MDVLTAKLKNRKTGIIAHISKSKANMISATTTCSSIMFSQIRSRVSFALACDKSMVTTGLAWLEISLRLIKWLPETLSLAHSQNRQARKLRNYPYHWPNRKWIVPPYYLPEHGIELRFRMSLRSLKGVTFSRRRHSTRLHFICSNSFAKQPMLVNWILALTHHSGNHRRPRSIAFSTWWENLVAFVANGSAATYSW